MSFLCFFLFFWARTYTRRITTPVYAHGSLLATRVGKGRLDYFNGYDVSTGAAFNLDRHVFCPFFFCGSALFIFLGGLYRFLVFTAARSLALLARGLKTVSDSSAVTGCLVSTCSSASKRSPPASAKACFTKRSSRL